MCCINTVAWIGLNNPVDELQTPWLHVTGPHWACSNWHLDDMCMFISVSLCRTSIRPSSLFLEAAGPKSWPWVIPSFLGKYTHSDGAQMLWAVEAEQTETCADLWLIYFSPPLIAASCSFIGQSKFPERAESLRRLSCWQRSLREVRCLSVCLSVCQIPAGYLTDTKLNRNTFTACWHRLTQAVYLNVSLALNARNGDPQTQR